MRDVICETFFLVFRSIALALFWERIPVHKVVQLLTDLEAKIEGEDVEAHREHEEFTARCRTQSSDLTFAV